MAFTSFAAFFTNISTLLAGVAPSVRGRDAKTRQLGVVQYSWIWKGVRTAKDMRPHKASGVPTNTPKLVQDDIHRIEVHMWGLTEDDVEKMRAALVTALRSDLKGRRYEIGDALIVDIAADQQGVLLVLELEVQLPLYLQYLPPTAPAQQPGGQPPSVTVQDATLPTVTITQVDTDTTGAAQGDGELWLGET